MSEPATRGTSHLSRERSPMLDMRVVTSSLALFTTASFLLCVGVGLVTPTAFHMRTFLEAVLPAFHWLTPAGFVLGLAESFLWGAYIGLVYVPIHNALARRAAARGAP